MTRSIRRTPRAALACGALALVMCRGGGGSGALQPPEVFRFGNEPISFSPLGAPWSRDRPVLSQALRGVHFDINRGVVAEIDVGEYPSLPLVSARDCARLLLGKLGEMANHKAQSRVADCIGPREASTEREEPMLREFEAHREAAASALAREDLQAAEASLAAAVSAAEQAQYEVEDAIHPAYRFSPEKSPEAHRFADVVEERATVGGRPALRIRYRVTGGSLGDRHGRWLYVLGPDSHLLALHYLGNEAELATFDALVATVSFPGTP